jgi:DNA replication and repair protein RecF
VLQRQHSVTALNRLAQGIHWEISSQTERLEVAYISNIGIEEGLAGVESRFRQALRQIRRREIAQGMTMAGPHRDGLQFKVNKADMSKYGSRGQQQTIAISLKLAEAQHMYAEVGDYPIMLLDDVFSELDRYRRQHLLESIAPFQQVLISAVDLDCFEPSCLARADHFRVRQGIIESA